MALNEKDQDMEQELEQARLYLQDLPEVRLPASLTAESLFERLDELEQKEAESQQQQKNGKVLFWKTWRPVLSYAAVFILLVAVYYGMGIDTQKPAQLMSSDAAVSQQTAEAALPQAQQAAPTEENASPRAYLAQEAPQGDAPAEAPAEESAPAADTRQDSPGENEIGPMLASSGEATAQSKANSEEDSTTAYYTGVVEALRQVEFWPETQTEQLPQLPGNEIVVRDGDLYFRYKNIDGQPNIVEIYQDKGLTPVSSFQVADAVIVDLVPLGDRLAVVEQEDDSSALYTGQLLTPLEEGQAAALPQCGAVTVSVYDLSDLEQPRLVESFTQDGKYLDHMPTENGLVMVTRKHIDLTEGQAALLCHGAPIIRQGNNAVAQALSPQQVTAYQGETGREYVVLSLVDLSGEDRPTQTQAVLGSRLNVQLSPNAIFVLDSEAQDNGGKPQAVFDLGEIEVQLR